MFDHFFNELAQFSTIWKESIEQKGTQSTVQCSKS